MRTMSRQTEHSRGRLLVVDDDLVQRTIIGKIGAKTGYDAVIAPSFDLASELLQRETFDIMTLDLSLGERDGVELLRMVAQSRLHSMPIVIISGCDERILNSTRRMAEGLDLSLAGCLTKPLNLDSLRGALCQSASGRLSPGLSPVTPKIDRDSIVAGLANSEFYVEFQPKIDLETGKVMGAEALARWRSAEFGNISPSVFIPHVEQFGLMPDLTNQILVSAIATSRDVIETHPTFTVAVNVSNSLMTDLMLPERIENILKSAGVPPEHLVVEVTESVAMSDVDRAMDVLVRLRIKGVGAAIDDFGTGFSSLGALARLPFNELKIDQSFVKGCTDDEDMLKIVEASVALGKAFDMRIVAEGVDNPATLARVRRAGCDIGQGYLFSPSLRFDRMQQWMAQRETDIAAHLPMLEPRTARANRFSR